MKDFIRSKFILVLIVLIVIAIVIISPVSNIAPQTNAQETDAFTYFLIPTYPYNVPYGITSGPDGNLWFTQYYVGRIDKITPDGSITEYSLPNKSTLPFEIISGPDGNLWFTETNGGKIGRITPSGTITEFQTPNRDSSLLGITVGSDNNIWFTEQFGNKIGRITPSGTVSEFSIPTIDSRPHDITSGPDGNLWFTELYGNKVGRITLNGDITEFTLPKTSSYPANITMGSDNNIWFTEWYEANRIGRITPNGDITEFPIPTIDGSPLDIVSGSDGNLWFSQDTQYSSMIGRITPSGTITMFSAPRTFYSITSGPDGNLWATQSEEGVIWRINISNLNYPILTPTPTPTPTPPGGILNVPYFSQNASSWGPTEYDHTQYFGITGIYGSMDRWGCAVTSVAMVLNYHTIKQFENGTPIDPGSLNEWLKNYGGYSYGYGANGDWYSYLNWNTIGTLTQQLYSQGKAPYKLEFNPPHPNIDPTTLLNNDLIVGNQLGKIPNILFVNNNGHFVVAKGITGNTYVINDPEWNYPTLASFNDTYSEVKRYVPSQTNLSYITAVVNPDVELLITDSQSRKTGKLIENGQPPVTYNEIPDATYHYEPPIKNPNDQGILEQLGTGVNEFLLPMPTDGEYTITVSSSTQTNYTLNVSTYEQDGNSDTNKTEAIVAPNENGVFIINYSQSQPSQVNKEVTFESTINDVNDLYTLNLITQKSAANNLIRNIEQAENASISRDMRKVLQNLDQFIAILDRARGGKIIERAYQILFLDVNVLKKQYTN